MNHLIYTGFRPLRRYCLFAAIVVVVLMMSSSPMLTSIRGSMPDGISKYKKLVTEDSPGLFHDTAEIPMIKYASLELHATMAMKSSHYAIVQIHNIDATNTYSVMALAYEHYTIAARQIDATILSNINHTEVSNQTASFQFIEYHLDFLAETNVTDYEVLVYESQPVEGTSSASRKPPRLITPSPFTVSIPPPRTSLSAIRQMPPCQAEPFDTLLPWTGHWVGPNGLAPNRRMRTGWTFLPDKCELEVFSPEEITSAAKNQPVTIAVLGTSRERGIFLSMVDLALHSNEKSNLETSKVGKCWGRAMIEVNDLKLIYQDVRTQIIYPDENPNAVTCHAANVALGSGMYRNTTEMMKNLFEQENPQVLVLWSGCYSTLYYDDSEKFLNASCIKTLKTLLGNLPYDWKGTLYVTEGQIVADTAFLTADQYHYYIRNMQSLPHFFNDTRVQFITLEDLVSPMRLHGERPGIIRGSTHYHRWCNEKEGEIRVCSNVTEALAQLLLSRAIAPNGRRHLQLNTTGVKRERRVKVCTDCPENLIPMHVKPKPDLDCYIGGLTAVQAPGEPYFMQCPSECMEKEPTSKFQTQSGTVEVRECIINPNLGD